MSILIFFTRACSSNIQKIKRMSFEDFDCNTIKLFYKDVNHDYNIDVGTEYKNVSTQKTHLLNSLTRYTVYS